jgi:chaperone modulatory protein CbpM
MADKTGSSVLSGVILDDSVSFSLGELCYASGLCAEEIISMVEEGLLEPQGSSPSAWSFSAESLRRLHIALRLQRDLQVNLAGAALVLDLLDELRILRERLRTFEPQGL